ncbi:MAG: copper resistance CopC family protein [Actinomycetota bacterium]
MNAPRIVRVLLGSLAVVVALTPVAQAHAAYKDSDPADESSVASAPAEIWAEFTEPPAQGSTLTVFNECGDRVDLGNSRIDGFRIYIGVDSAHRGGFRVDFRVTSAYDSHVTTGNFTFAATSGEDCAGPPPESGNAEAGANGGDGGGSGGGSSDAGDDGSGSLTEVASISERGDGDGSGSRARGERAGRDRDRGSAGDDPDADAGPIAEPPPDTPGIWDGIELRDLLIGYALAMLIGAAGGKIYAGIVGPRR